MQHTHLAWMRRASLLSILPAVFLVACTSSPPSPVRTSQTPAWVYVASLTKGQAAYTYTQTISALSASTSQERWKVPLETADLIGHWGTPVISNSVVYASSAHSIDSSHATGSLAAINAQDGHVLWRTAIGVAASDPVIQHGVVYISAAALPDPNDSSGLKRSVFALKERDGSILWQTTISGDFAKLVLNGDTIYSISNDWCFDACSHGALVAAINASTGALLWNQEITQAYHLSLPRFVDGALYFSTYDYHRAVGSIPSAAVLAVNSQDGSVRWSVPVYTASYDDPVIANGMIYADLATIPDPSHPNMGTYAVAVLSLDDGKVAWQSPTDTYPSPPVLADGVIYLTSSVTPCENANCYTYFVSAFNARDGKRLWRVQTDQLPSAPRVANGKVFLVFTLFPGRSGSDNHFSLVALDTQTGALAWRASFGLDQSTSRDATTVVISGGVFYIGIGGTHDGPGELFAVNEQSGASQWTWKTVGFIGGLTVIP